MNHWYSLKRQNRWLKIMRIETCTFHVYIDVNETRKAKLSFFVNWKEIITIVKCFLFWFYCLLFYFHFRGASLRFLPTVAVHGYFYCAAVFSILFHCCVLLIRAKLRSTDEGTSYTNNLSNIGGIQAYGLIGWPVWVASIFLLPLGGIFSSVIVNRYDGTAHRRYLQYLRLEFDTRLGMHSPRWFVCSFSIADNV